MRTGVHAVALFWALVSVLSPGFAPAAMAADLTDTIVIESRDPATVSLHDLVTQADVVALVVVVGGDDERYAKAIYKARVLKGFKGVQENEQLYFGPFTSYSLGSEYVVALKRTSQRVGDLAKGESAGAPYRPEAPYLRIMYEGYSVLAVDYTCEIPSCDDAVEVSDEQITLPRRLRTFPTECTDHARHFVWVRKGAFLRELARLTNRSAE